jgi:peptidyl-dipeptidase A
MLSLGKSGDWRDAVKVATGGLYDNLDANAMLNYFRPLLAWLQQQNHGKMCGWKK